MRVITRQRLRALGNRHPDAAEPLRKWHRVMRGAKWLNVQDVRRVYPHADLVTAASGNVVTVFNVGGNKFRLIAAIHYNCQRIYILRLLRHRDYSQGRWKEDL